MSSVKEFPSIRGFKQKTGRLPLLVHKQILDGRLTVQQLDRIVKEDKELFLKYLTWFTEIMKGITDPVRLHKAKQFMGSVIQKHGQDEKVVRQVNQHVKQLQTALSKYEKTKQQIWSRHSDIHQLLTRRVVNPTTTQLQQVRTYLKKPETDLILFVMPDNTLVLTPSSPEYIVRCDGRRRQQYMDPKQGQSEAQIFYRYTGPDGHHIYIDTTDMDKHTTKMHQQNKYIFPKSPNIIFLSDETETIPSTFSMRALQRISAGGSDECPQDSSITVHKITKITHIPRDYIP